MGCYQQNDASFDSDSNILHRKITITDREQHVSYVITQMVCRDRPAPQQPVPQQISSNGHQRRAAEQLPSGLRCRRPEPWSLASWTFSFKVVLGALTGGRSPD